MNPNIPKISVRLAKHEINALHRYFTFLVSRSWNNLPRTDNDMIVLIEFYAKVDTLMRTTEYRAEPKKGFSFTMALSVARILHTRLQEGTFNEVLVMILGKIDYSLNSVHMAPIKDKTLNI
jgi:hypothetical protein